MQLTPVFVPGKFRGQSSLAGCNPWGHKESDNLACIHGLKPQSASQNTFSQNLNPITVVHQTKIEQGKGLGVNVPLSIGKHIHD